MPPLRHTPARTFAAAAGLAAAAALSLATAAAAAPAGADTTNATDQYNAALKAVGSQGVHFDSVAHQNGATLVVSGDAGTTSGAQMLTVKSKNLDEHMTALVVGPTGYVSGNAAALQNVIGLTKAQSSKYAGKWLSFPTSNAGLSELVGGLLSSQVSKEVEIGGPYSYGDPTTVAGQQATAIKGSVATQSGGKVPVVLYFPSSGTPLPIREVTNASKSGGSSAIHGTVTFSHWGENKSQTAPTHTVSLLKLVPASSSTGG
jgi:hypothetical protein